MINIDELFQIVLNILLVVLVVSLIVLVVNAIKTLNKVDSLVDDLSVKSSKLDGLFNVVDTATDTVVSFSDNIVSFIASSLAKVFKRKRDKDE